MGSMRMKYLCSSLKSAGQFDGKRSITFATKSYHTSREIFALKKLVRSPGYSSCYMGSQLGLSPSERVFQRSLRFPAIIPFVSNRLFSSASEGKGSINGSDVTAGSSVSGTNVSDSGVGGVNGDGLIEKIKEMYQSTVGVVGEKVKEASDLAAPHVNQLLDANPYLRDVIAPVGCTLGATVLAWWFLPKILKRFHKYSVEGPGALLGGSSMWGSVPYEKSFWGALEDPIRYFVTFNAFLQIGEMVAPTVIVSQHVAQAWKGALIISLVWFLHRWKTNVISRALAGKSIGGVERDKLMTLDKGSTVGLFFVGSMALAEACGVAVQSILTVGGIGGVATAFASKDILGNALSGLSLHLSQPFTVGDKIKAGSVEGQVTDIGFTTTSLLTAEQFPAIVPNSLFSSQVIVNKSRANWRSIIRTVPLQTDDVEMISKISEDIKCMLRSHSNVFLDKEAPYCFLSQIERSYAELTLGCNLKQMDKDTEQDILLQAVRIIKGHGAALGSKQDFTSQ